MPIHELIPFRPGLNKLKNSQSVYTWNWPVHAKQNKLSMDRASLPVFILLLIQQRRYLATGIVEAKKAQKPKISEKWRLHNLDSYFLQQNIVFLSTWCGFLVWKKNLFSSQCKWRMISTLPLLKPLSTEVMTNQFSNLQPGYSWHYENWNQMVVTPRRSKAKCHRKQWKS